jgi:serine/threonine protein kinase
MRLSNKDRIKIGNHVLQVELSPDMVGGGPAPGSLPLPTLARDMVFCPITFRATAKSDMVRSEQGTMVSPECDASVEYTPGMIQGYQLVERLGEGRVGVVFKARHLALNKDIAIKVLRSDRARDALELRRWTREAKIGGRLFHPHILEMYDAAVCQGHYYICMEYIDGETLAERVGLYGGLPVVEIVSYGAKIARGLQHAHDEGIIHRALSPACIFLGAQGQVKLGDFGLAKVLWPGEDPLTPRGEAIGSLLYMAPEQLESGRDVDHLADIFGLGASLYHGLVGKPPFGADSVAGVLANRRRGALRPLLEARPDCPEPLSAAIAHCLASDRAQRYQSAGELATALEAM